MDKVSDAAQEASDWAFLKDDGVEDDEGREIGEGDANDPEGENGSGSEEGEEKEGQSGEGGETPSAEMDQNSEMQGSPQDAPDEPGAPSMADPAAPPDAGAAPGQTGEQGGSSQTGESSNTQEPPGPENNPDSQNADAESQAEETGEAQPLPDEPQSAPDESETASAEWVGPLVKGLIYLTLVAAAAWFGYKHRKEIRAALRQFWANILALFGKKPPRVIAAPEAEESPELPPFAAFQNPFASGSAQSLPPEELVRYTFEALQAWAKERELERPPDQTPIEFARRLGAYIPELAHEAGQLTRIYSNYAYAGRTPTGDWQPLIRTLWAKLG